MSLIYRALKSLQVSRGEAPGKVKPHAEKRPRSRIQQLQHRFISPGVVLITAGLLIIAGFALVLGVEWLVQQSRLVETQVVGGDQPRRGELRQPDDEPATIRVEDQPPTRQAVNPAPPAPEPFEAPRPPPVTYSGEGRRTIEQATGVATPAAPSANDEPEFVPPAESAAEVAFISPSAPAADMPAIAEAPEPASPETPVPARPVSVPTLAPAEPATAPPLDPRAAPQPLPEGGGAPGAMASAAPDPDTAFQIARRPVGDDRSTVAYNGAAQRPGAASPEAEGSAAPPPPQASHPPPPGPGVSMKVKRQARYAVMAHQLRAAMDEGRGQDVEKLLGEIARLKGANDHFVLKMRAYWHLRNQRYALSEVILAQLLDHTPGDLDVQLNMAVLEAHTGRRDAATARLAALAKRYPGEARVSSMAEMLN